MQNIDCAVPFFNSAYLDTADQIECLFPVFLVMAECLFLIKYTFRSAGAQSFGMIQQKLARKQLSSLVLWWCFASSCVLNLIIKHSVLMPHFLCNAISVNCLLNRFLSGTIRNSNGIYFAIYLLHWIDCCSKCRCRTSPATISSRYYGWDEACLGLK